MLHIASLQISILKLLSYKICALDFLCYDVTMLIFWLRKQQAVQHEYIVRGTAGHMLCMS